MNPVQVPLRRPQRRPQRCSQCRMERCSKNHPGCPIYLMNEDLARQKPLYMLTGVVPEDRDPTGINWRTRHIQQYISINLDNPKLNCPGSLIARYIDRRNLPGEPRVTKDVLNDMGITVTKTDTPCDPEECGICLETNCTVTTNCNHNYCVGCINGIVLHRLPVNCAYCRCKITELKTHDVVIFE